jgi:hypothetical protein
VGLNDLFNDVQRKLGPQPLLDAVIGVVLNAIQSEFEEAFKKPDEPDEEPQREPRQLRRINTRSELIDLQRELGLRLDWHEPDEQDVTARVEGSSFDNAGFWGNPGTALTQELHVVIYQQDRAVAAINLATLFAWATGYHGEG